jgi:nucleoid-associated protein YgaU
MATYYRKIKGKNYDRALLEVAESAVSGKGDNRISLRDAQRIVKKVKDGGAYTDVEKRTVKYIRDKFKFTGEADKWFRAEIGKLKAPKQEAPKAKKPAAKAKKPAAKAKKPAAKAKKPAAKAKKPAAKAKKPAARRDESFFDQEMARLEKAKEAAPSPPGKEKKPKSPFLKIAILVLIIIFIIILILICPRKKPEEEITTPTAPPDEVAVKKGETTEMVPKEPVKEEPVKEEPVKEAEPPEEVLDTSKYYLVKEKDDLINISEELTGNYKDWKKLYEANKDKIKDPKLIYPGQKLLLPEDMQKK